MKKLSTTKFKALERKAIIHLEKHSSTCDDMLELIRPLISFELENNDCVFHQTGDGYCLSWESKRSASNTPVFAIINHFNAIGRTLDEDDLLSISI